MIQTSCCLLPAGIYGEYPQTSNLIDQIIDQFLLPFTTKMFSNSIKIIATKRDDPLLFVKLFSNPTTNIYYSTRKSILPKSIPTIPNSTKNSTAIPPPSLFARHTGRPLQLPRGSATYADLILNVDRMLSDLRCRRSHRFSTSLRHATYFCNVAGRFDEFLDVADEWFRQVKPYLDEQSYFKVTSNLCNLGKLNRYSTTRNGGRVVEKLGWSTIDYFVGRMIEMGFHRFHAEDVASAFVGLHDLIIFPTTNRRWLSDDDRSRISRTLDEFLDTFERYVYEKQSSDSDWTAVVRELAPLSLNYLKGIDSCRFPIFLQRRTLIENLMRLSKLGFDDWTNRGGGEEVTIKPVHMSALVFYAQSVVYFGFVSSSDFDPESIADGSWRSWYDSYFRSMSVCERRFTFLDFGYAAQVAERFVAFRRDQFWPRFDEWYAKLMELMQRVIDRSIDGGGSGDDDESSIWIGEEARSSPRSTIVVENDSTTTNRNRGRRTKLKSVDWDPISPDLRAILENSLDPISMIADESINHFEDDDENRKARRLSIKIYSKAANFVYNIGNFLKSAKNDREFSRRKSEFRRLAELFDQIFSSIDLYDHAITSNLISRILYGFREFKFALADESRSGESWENIGGRPAFELSKEFYDRLESWCVRIRDESSMKNDGDRSPTIELLSGAAAIAHLSIDHRPPRSLLREASISFYVGLDRSNCLVPPDELYIFGAACWELHYDPSTSSSSSRSDRSIGDFWSKYYAKAGDLLERSSSNQRENNIDQLLMILLRLTLKFGRTEEFLRIKDAYERRLIEDLDSMPQALRVRIWTSIQQLMTVTKTIRFRYDVIERLKSKVKY